MVAPNAEMNIEHICQWLRQQAQNMGAHGAVLELDGSINSVVVAALARRVFGENVLGVILHCHNSTAEIKDAAAAAKQVDIQYQIVDLTDHYDSLRKRLVTANTIDNLGVAAHLRMAVLYCYATSNNYLALGTLSRSNWEIGNFTSHGEDAADLFPILHLTQSELPFVARSLSLPGSLLEDDRQAKKLQFSPSEVSRFGFSLQELDTFLAERLSQLPDDIKVRIQNRRQSAFHKKLPISQRSLLEFTPEKDFFQTEDQEAYGKSIEALTLISKAITSEEYLEDILRLIVMVTAEVMNSSVCSLWLLDEKEAVLRLRATQSIDREYLKDRVLKVGEGVVGKVVAEKQPYIVTNVLEDPFYKEKELARRMHLVSMLSMPMRVKNKVIGVINCYTSHPHVFSDLQMNVLTAVANQAAVAIEKTELIVQTKVIQEELEKRKLIERAKDLLMKRLDLSGEEAYRWLQKRSMNMRKSMREVAEAVLLTMEG